MLTAFIEDAELATLEPQDAPQESYYVRELCRQDALLDTQAETPEEIEKLWTAGEMTPDKAFERCMYMLVPRWPPSFLEADYRCSRWIVASRALAGNALWPRYVAAEKAYDQSGTHSVDVEMREACGRAWMKAGLHHIGNHMQPPRHRHHAEKPKARERRKREPREDTRIRLWLDPQLKAERVAEQSGGIMRGTLR
jgi:hypothetical protein